MDFIVIAFVHDAAPWTKPGARGDEMVRAAKCIAAANYFDTLEGLL